MKLILLREEALAALIALENKRNKGGWDKTAIIKIAETLNLNPHLAASTQFASCHGWNATRKD